jgi:hypothetical protein
LQQIPSRDSDSFSDSTSAPYATLAVALALVVYAPLLKNYFWLDDFLILNLVTNMPVGKFITGHWAGHLVIVRNAFYAGMHAIVGANPMPYYLVLLALHGVNVGLVFAIVHTVTRSAPLACLAAAAWGTSPLDEGALGWLAASGNAMVATTTLAVLYGTVRAAWGQTRVGLPRAALWGGLLLAGTQSFGTGLGIAIGAPVLLAWLTWEQMTRGARVLLLAVPVVTGWMYGANYSQFTGRLGSSALAKADMLLHLHVIGVTTLVRGLGYEPGPSDFLPPIAFDPSTFPTLSTTACLIAALVACLWTFAAAWSSTGRTRRLLITLAVLVLCNYGAIAVGRAFFSELFHQSTVRWAAQARYHYSATALLAVGLAVVVATLVGKRLPMLARPALVVWLVVSGILYARSGWTIRHYDAGRQRAERILARIDAAIRATPPGEPVVTYNEPFPDGPYICGAASLYVMNRDDGDREVYFVDPGAVIIYREFPGSPLARVLVPPQTTGLACEARPTLRSESR